MYIVVNRADAALEIAKEVLRAKILSVRTTCEYYVHISQYIHTITISRFLAHEGCKNVHLCAKTRWCGHASHVYNENLSWYFRSFFFCECKRITVDRFYSQLKSHTFMCENLLFFKFIFIRSQVLLNHFLADAFSIWPIASHKYYL